MAVGITNAPETLAQVEVLGKRNVLVNQEVGSVCRMTNVCLNSCHLAWSHALAGDALSTEDLVNGGVETFGHHAAALVRHWGLAAKEPLQYASSVASVARAWHSASPELRPGTLGVLTAFPSALVEQSKTWKSTPLSWVLVSADPAGTELHPELQGNRVLEAATKARDSGGVRVIGCNTTVSGAVAPEDLIQIGRRAEALGFDQWSLGGLYQPQGPRLEDTLSEKVFKSLLDLVVAEFSRSSMLVTLALSERLFAKWMGGWEHVEPLLGGWRLEKWISPNVVLIAPNPKPGHFLRLRWDGELLDQEDLLRVDCRHGVFGSYQPGVMRRTLESFPTLQSRRDWHPYWLTAA